MRWTQWIWTAALVAACVGQANGQFGCRGCGGGQSNSQYLSGDACYSPPGYAGGIASSGCSGYCGPSRSCCDNAWAGYCCHHAKVQAFLTRIGTPKVRCYPCGPQTMTAVADDLHYPDGMVPSKQSTPTVAPPKPLPPVPPTPANETGRTTATKPRVSPQNASAMPRQRWSR
jgi:hypothetical protein